MNEHTNRAKTIFVNCWQCYTCMSIYSQIANAIGEMLPRRGLATDEMFGRISEVMKKENIRCVVVLDNMDSLICHGEQKFLYDLTRSVDGKPMFGVIGISKKSDLLKRLDSRIESAIAFSPLRISNYTEAQIADILEERAGFGLTPGSWSMAIIDACASKAAQKGGNVHYGLELLLEAAKEAEGANKREIGLEDVEKACVVQKEERKQTKSIWLMDGEQLILDILRDGEIDTITLYELFHRKMQRSGRQIRNYLKSLEDKGLIMTRVMKGASKIGNKRFIRLRCVE